MALGSERGQATRVEAMRTCPRCLMVHPDEAARCQCDYDLQAPTYDADIAGARRGIARLRLALGLLFVAGAALVAARALGALAWLPAYQIVFAMLVDLVLIGGATVAASRVRETSP